jgi:outer membrane protein assembly factor BamB
MQDMKPDMKSIGGGSLVAVLVLIFIFTWNGCPSKPHAAAQSPTIKKKWEFTATGPITASLVLADDGTLYVGSEDGFLYALDAEGKLQWKFYAGPILAAPTVGSDGAIYVTNRRGRVFALNSTGTRRWQVDTYDGETYGKTGGALGTSNFYAPTRDGLCAIGLEDGTIRWKAGLGFEQYASVTLLSNGLLVFPGHGRLNAVNSDGQIVWQYPPLTQDAINKNSGYPPPGSTFVESGIAPTTDGLLLGGAADSRMLAVTSDGNLKWGLQTKVRSFNRATPVISSDGTIYEASADSTVYALYPDGSQKWAYDTHNSLIATPVLAADGTIYDAGGLYLIALSPTGELEEKVRLPNGVESSPVLAPDGTIYVATNQGKVLAFAGKHGDLMNSPWPKFQADSSNSGRPRSF